MKIQEIMDKIYAFHPSLNEREETTIDGLKIGNPDQECTGIATGIFASVEVIEQAHAAGANLLVVHEPVFYDHFDKDEARVHNEVAKKKVELCEKYGMVIIRDHDHIHAHRPDGIYYGVMTELGIQAYLKSDLLAPRDPEKFGFFFEFPGEGIPVKEFAALWQKKLGLKNVRLIGNPETMVKRMGWGGHCLPDSRGEIKKVEAMDVDLYIPGECIDWEIAEYYKDAGGFGLNKCMMLTGHFNKEELGMKHAVTWISRLVDYKIPVIYCSNHDMYWYLQNID